MCFSVNIPVRCWWGSEWVLLGICCVVLSPIAVCGCVFSISRVCHFVLGAEPCIVYPPTPISLRVGVLPRWSHPYVLPYVCIVFCIFDLWGCVSSFPYVQVVCRCSPVSGLSCPVGSKCCGVRLSVWRCRRVLYFMRALSGWMCRVEAFRSACAFLCLFMGEVLPVCLSVCFPWGAVMYVLGLW